MGLLHDVGSWDHVQFTFNPGAHTPVAGEVLIGLGNPHDPASAGVSLNSKFEGSVHRSVSAFVHAADDRLLAAWRAKLPNGWADVRRVALEDLSLDSCFALLQFAHRMGCADVTPLPSVDSWCRYVTRWEEGQTREERSWGESIAFLVTILGHSYLDLEQQGNSVSIAPATFDQGMRSCLALIEAAAGQGTDPGAVDCSKLAHLPAFQRARSHLDHERMQYLLALRRGSRCQLCLPLAGSGRAVLVDALFLEERNPSGVLKVFARSDRANTWTGRGFDVLGLYRPGEAGTGGDMTISLAPESGLTLRAVWTALERLEDDRWGSERPRDAPRWIKSYEGIENAPNQPWWDDYGRYTLIGAPKRVAIKGGLELPGTRLDWYRDVLPTVWQCYSPVPQSSLRVERDHAVSGKRLAICRWRDDPDSSAKPADQATLAQYSAVYSPTFRAWLKSLSMASGPVTSPADLPPEASFELFELSGGYVVVHQDGATIYDDWTEVPVETSGIRTIFDALAAAWGGLTAFHGARSLEQALHYQQTLLGHSARFEPKAFERWKEQSMTARALVLKASAGAIDHADPWPLNKLRTLLRGMWGLDERRQETLDLIDRIDKVTSEIAGHLREHRARLLQALGAGVGLGILVKEVVEVFEPLFVANAYAWQLALVRRFLPPEVAGQLEHVVHALHAWHLGAAAALVLGCLFGFFGYLRYGAKAGGH